MTAHSVSFGFDHQFLFIFNVLPVASDHGTRSIVRIPILDVRDFECDHCRHLFGVDPRSLERVDFCGILWFQERESERVALDFCPQIIVQHHWIHFLIGFVPNDRPFTAHSIGCIFKLFGSLSVFLWMNTTSYIVYRLLLKPQTFDKNYVQRIKRIFHGVSWPIALSVAIIPLAADQYTIATPDGPWCFIDGMFSGAVSADIDLLTF